MELNERELEIFEKLSPQGKYDYILDRLLFGQTFVLEHDGYYERIDPEQLKLTQDGYEVKNNDPKN